MGDLPSWAGIIVAIAVGVLGLFLKRKDKQEEEALNVETNPDADTSDFDERMHNPGELPSKPEGDSDGS